MDLKKVLLISGPAGLGKTTLCHVIGKMCGYNVIEINASEDRSGEDVKRRIIESATSLCIRDKKPNLLVIDEIDGALEQGSLISTLIELCSSQHASNTTDSDEKPTKKRKIKQALNSPIICICNEP